MLVFSGSRSNVNRKAFPRSSSYLRSLTKCCRGKRRVGGIYNSCIGHQHGPKCSVLLHNAKKYNFAFNFMCSHVISCARPGAAVFEVYLDFCTQFSQLLLRHGGRLVRQPSQLLCPLLPGIKNQH